MDADNVTPQLKLSYIFIQYLAEGRKEHLLQAIPFFFLTSAIYTCSVYHHAVFSVEYTQETKNHHQTFLSLRWTFGSDNVKLNFGPADHLCVQTVRGFGSNKCACRAGRAAAYLLL